MTNEEARALVPFEMVVFGKVVNGERPAHLRGPAIVLGMRPEERQYTSRADGRVEGTMVFIKLLTSDGDVDWYGCRAWKRTDKSAIPKKEILLLTAGVEEMEMVRKGDSWECLK
jgi:hypothetical protein